MSKAAKECLLLWVAKECSLLRVANELGGKSVCVIVGGKRAGQQKSVFHHGRQKELGNKRVGR